MLSELRIENFAIIDQLELHFAGGLVIFTGETGAGKSILIDAVELLLGGRADTSMIRSEADRATVEGIFQIPTVLQEALHPILKREELLDDPNLLILGREIRLNGRNVARVNGRSVTSNLLREIGELLIDVHGQSEHLSLLRVNQHLHLLDSFAGIEDLLADYLHTYRQLQAVRKELADLLQTESEATRRIDLLSYQINEIEAGHLKIGEEDELRAERTRLANAEGLASLAQEALFALDEGTADAPSISDQAGRVVHVLKDLARLDPSQSHLLERSEGLFDELNELANDLRHYLEAIEVNPQRLNQVEERLELIHNLKRKYGDSIQAVLEFGEQARRQREAIAHAGERIRTLQEQEEKLLHQLGREGQAISRKRHQEAENLARELEAELAELNMARTRFLVDFQQRPDPRGVPLEDGRRVAFDTHGLERVEFLIAPNPGEGFKPLAKIASGGETSRLMLGLKNVLARADPVPILIFDEIDQGIGGRVGSVVGAKLSRLANRHQVLCVTHLPQLAAFGDQHFHVQKEINQGRTLTRVALLEGEPRLLELAQMFGEVSEGTLKSAREVMEAAGRI